MNKLNYFYDIHFHSFNLSHPNLLAFLNRVGMNRILTYNSFFAPCVKLFGTKKINHILNLLSIMENSIGDYFLIVEYLLKKDKALIDEETKKLYNTYDRIILTPLMVDFYYQKLKPGNYFYNIPPKKPIIDQVIDVFWGIKNYLSVDLFELNIPGDKKYDYINSNPDNKLFEIYPFMGLNTQNYSFERLEKMLDKYFGNYKGTHEALLENFNRLTSFDGNINSLGSNYFAGIKVYPPLGFDPWPSDSGERKKVELLYQFCVEKRIPITTHCSDGGFCTIDKKKALINTSPDTWYNVLKQYNTLKINFAHLGAQCNHLFLFPNIKWQKKIIELILEFENVYTDFSCIARNLRYYHNLRQILDSHEGTNLNQKILFGSDFMINLIWLKSYNEYLALYNYEYNLLTSTERELFYQINPRRFLFK